VFKFENQRNENQLENGHFQSLLSTAISNQIYEYDSIQVTPMRTKSLKTLGTVVINGILFIYFYRTVLRRVRYCYGKSVGPYPAHTV